MKITLQLNSGKDQLYSFVFDADLRTAEGRQLFDQNMLLLRQEWDRDARNAFIKETRVDCYFAGEYIFTGQLGEITADEVWKLVDIPLGVQTMVRAFSKAGCDYRTVINAADIYLSEWNKSMS